MRNKNTSLLQYRELSSIAGIVNIFIFLFLFGLLILNISSCTPPLVKYTQVGQPKQAKSHDSQIYVYNINDPVPNSYIMVGMIYVGDDGLSVGCENFNSVVEIALQKAREAGGDAIKITKVMNPDFMSSCYRVNANVLAFIETDNWPKISMTETDAKKYFDVGIGSLDPIEGIWNISAEGTYRKLSTGEIRPFKRTNSYRLAIIKNSQSKQFDFVGFVLESSYNHWKQGLVKANFRITADKSIYECIWFNKDLSKNRLNFTFYDDGTFKTSVVMISQGVETSSKIYMIKAYPQFDYKKSKVKPPKTAGTIGTGFLISNNGWIATNFHVVRDVKNIEVIFPDQNLSQDADIIIKDSKNDLAILQIKDFNISEIAETSIPFSIEKINSPQIGQEVYTMGFPLSNIMGQTARLSMGVINSEFGINDDPRILQISNPLQPGNSGGPLFNTNGELVGIAFSGLNAKYFYENLGVIPQNVNFGIKYHYLLNLIDMLPNGGQIVKRKNRLNNLVTFKSYGNK